MAHELEIHLEDMRQSQEQLLMMLGVEGVGAAHADVPRAPLPKKTRARRARADKDAAAKDAATAAPTQCILPVTARTTVTANTAQKALLHKKARFCSGSSRLTVFHQYQIASMKISRIISLGIADWLH